MAHSNKNGDTLLREDLEDRDWLLRLLNEKTNHDDSVIGAVETTTAVVAPQMPEVPDIEVDYKNEQGFYVKYTKTLENTNRAIIIVKQGNGNNDNTNAGRLQRIIAEEGAKKDQYTFCLNAAGSFCSGLKASSMEGITIETNGPVNEGNGFRGLEGVNYGSGGVSRAINEVLSGQGYIKNEGLNAAAKEGTGLAYCGMGHYNGSKIIEFYPLEATISTGRPRDDGVFTKIPEGAVFTLDLEKGGKFPVHFIECMSVFLRKKPRDEAVPLLEKSLEHFFKKSIDIAVRKYKKKSKEDSALKKLSIITTQFSADHYGCKHISPAEYNRIYSDILSRVLVKKVTEYTTDIEVQIVNYAERVINTSTEIITGCYGDDINDAACKAFSRPIEELQKPYKSIVIESPTVINGNNSKKTIRQSVLSFAGSFILLGAIALITTKQTGIFNNLGNDPRKQCILTASIVGALVLALIISAITYGISNRQRPSNSIKAGSRDNVVKDKVQRS